jgi:ribosomal protein S18 acetylase RimI-like enzyme
MDMAINYLEDSAVKKMILGVAIGNEDVYRFYEKYNFYPRTTILERI